MSRSWMFRSTSRSDRSAISHRLYEPLERDRVDDVAFLGVLGQDRAADRGRIVQLPSRHLAFTTSASACRSSARACGDPLLARAFVGQLTTNLSRSIRRK